MVWQPSFVEPGAIVRKEIPLKELERILSFLAIKGPLGGTRYTRSGSFAGRSGTILQGVRGGEKFNIYFNDKATGRNEVMRLYLYCGAMPAQLEHEMLRNVPGTKATVEKCGDGYVILSRAGRGVFVVWQVSDQMFVRIDDSFDPVMVAAYVNRLGSITPKGYEISVDNWVANEIRWRLQQLDERYKCQLNEGIRSIGVFSVYLTQLFPECLRYGQVKEQTPLAGIWTWLHDQRNFLWANRENFKYDDRTRAFFLKGPDRYDPEKPPELPDEIKDPPQPPEPTPNPSFQPPPVKQGSSKRHRGLGNPDALQTNDSRNVPGLSEGSKDPSPSSEPGVDSKVEPPKPRAIPRR